MPPDHGLGVEGGDVSAARVQPRHDQGCRVARSAGARPGCIVHDRVQSQGAEGPRQGRAGDPRADDGDLALGDRRRGGRAGKAGLQPFVLAPEPGLFFDNEPPGGEAASHGAGDGEGRRPRAGGRARRNTGQDPLAPHVRIARGGEAVEEPGVGRAGPRLQRLGGIHDGEVDSRAPGGQVDPMESQRRAWPARGKRHSQVRQLGPAGQGPPRVVGADREGFDGKNVQPRAGLSGAPPKVDQSQDVEARAETELAHGEAVTARPGARKAAAVQKHRPGFAQPVCRGEIDVVECPRARRAIVAPGDRGEAPGRGAGRRDGHRA